MSVSPRPPETKLMEADTGWPTSGAQLDHDDVVERGGAQEEPVHVGGEERLVHRALRGAALGAEWRCAAAPPRGAARRRPPRRARASPPPAAGWSPWGRRATVRGARLSVSSCRRCTVPAASVHRPTSFRLRATSCPVPPRRRRRRAPRSGPSSLKSDGVEEAGRVERLHLAGARRRPRRASGPWRVPREHGHQRRCPGTARGEPRARREVQRPRRRLARRRSPPRGASAAPPAPSRRRWPPAAAA